MKKELSIIINTRNRKNDLFALLRSIDHCSLPSSSEIIVVDDCSDENYRPELEKKFPKAILIKTPARYFLIKARNLGWQKAAGKYLFFIDDDNEIRDKDFFAKALRTLKGQKDIGVLGCRTYYFDAPQYILVGPSRFNKMTGRTSFLAVNQKDSPAYAGLVETHSCPNAFFTTKEITNEAGGFTEDIVQTISEADFDEKVRRSGLKVYESSDLKVYHKSPWQDYKKIKARHVGGTPERSYFLMRNRFVFIKRYGTFKDKILFTLLFSHIINSYYVIQLLMAGEMSMVVQCLRGILDGYFYMIFGKLNNYYHKKKV